MKYFYPILGLVIGVFLGAAGFSWAAGLVPDDTNNADRIIELNRDSLQSLNVTQLQKVVVYLYRLNKDNSQLASKYSALYDQCKNK